MFIWNIDSDQIESKDDLFSTTPDPIFAMLLEEYNYREQSFVRGTVFNQIWIWIRL